MCCFRNRQTPARIVFVLSGFIFVCSIGILLLTVRFYRSELFQNNGELSGFAESTFYTLISFSIVAFLVSISGMVSASIVKYRWPAVIFGIMLTVVTFVYIAFGISLATLSSSSEADMLEFCETKTRTSASNSKFRGYVYDIDMDITAIVNENMCREDVCPCSYLDQAPWMALSEEQLNKFQRTKAADNRNGDIPLFFCRECDTFATFETCYASWESNGYANSKTPGLR